MPQNKKQHYVPRFYLKRFSPNGVSINIWHTQLEKNIYSANLKNQCYKNYFYGKQPDIEKALASIEGEMSKILDKVTKCKTLPPRFSREHIIIMLYVLMQHGRTEYSASTADEMCDKLIKHLHREQTQSMGIDLDQFKIEIQDPAVFTLRMNTQLYPVLLDLNYKLLVNRTGIEFVTSDNPVVLYNQLFSFRDRRIGSCCGLAYKGLQIFFPIGPNAVLVFFDAGVYSVGKRRSLIVDVCLERDVYEINTLQMCSALNCVYFCDHELDIDALHRKASGFRRQNKATFKCFPQVKTENGSRELVAISNTDVRTNLDLTFSRVTKSAKKWKKDFQKKKQQPVAVLRSEKLVNDYEEFTNKVENNEFLYSEFFQFLETKYNNKNL